MNPDIQSVLDGGPGCIAQGDCLDLLRQMPDGCVQCVVTSPPYWGLRDYGTASWEGGEPECDHALPDDAGQSEKQSPGQRVHAGRFNRHVCWKCGAHRHDQQLGLEPTPEEYVQKMVEVFRLLGLDMQFGAAHKRA